MSVEPNAFVLSEKALNAVIAQIRDDQWDMPADTLVSDRSMTLREVVNGHAYDSAWVPDTLAGKTIKEVGGKYDGDLLGDDPKAAYAKLSQAAIDAAQDLKPADWDRIVHLTYGDFPVREYLKHIAIYRGFRSYTIAKLIGVDTTMPDELVDGLWEITIPDLADWRALGIFGPAIAVPEHSSKQTKLLAQAGFYRP